MGEVRLHVAVQTDPSVRFELGGERLAMQEGDLWYADFTHVHTVENASATYRIHLVIDCVVNEWLTELIENARDVVQPSSVR
jgi:hypothetical protein